MEFPSSRTIFSGIDAYFVTNLYVFRLAEQSPFGPVYCGDLGADYASLFDAAVL